MKITAAALAALLLVSAEAQVVSTVVRLSHYERNSRERRTRLC